MEVVLNRRLKSNHTNSSDDEDIEVLKKIENKEKLSRANRRTRSVSPSPFGRTEEMSNVSQISRSLTRGKQYHLNRRKQSRLVQEEKE